MPRATCRGAALAESDEVQVAGRTGVWMNVVIES